MWVVSGNRRIALMLANALVPSSMARLLGKAQRSSYYGAGMARFWPCALRNRICDSRISTASYGMSASYSTSTNSIKVYTECSYNNIRAYTSGRIMSKCGDPSRFEAVLWAEAEAAAAQTEKEKSLKIEKDMKANSNSSTSSSTTQSKRAQSRSSSSRSPSSRVFSTSAQAQSQSSPPKMFSDQITIVNNAATAKAVLAVLTDPKHKDVIWACDTEVADIDVKTQGPVGNGFVTCVSIFGGPDIDFGLGEGPGTALWIDNMNYDDGSDAAVGAVGSQEGVAHTEESKLKLVSAQGTLDLFKEWFEDHRYKKSWHNYSFDRHVMGNMDINCGGFQADTFHMARLWDTSRDKRSGGGGGYGLAALSEELVKDARLAKISMKDLFGVAKLKKDGSVGKIKELPSVRELQAHSEHRAKWIEYSAKDAVATWWVRYELQERLKRQEWIVDGKRLGNMYDFYNLYLKDFGDALTAMEKEGILVDTDGHLKQAEVLARQERAIMEKKFMDWAALYCADAKYMNSGSSSQVGAFLFGHYERGKLISKERVFRIDKSDVEIEQEAVQAITANPYVNMSTPEIKAIMKERGLKLPLVTSATSATNKKAGGKAVSSSKKSDLVACLLADDALPVRFLNASHESLIDMCSSRGLNDEGTTNDLIMRLTVHSASVQAATAQQDKLEEERLNIAESGKPKKWREITISTIGLTPTDFSPAKTPQVSATVLRKLSGHNLFTTDEKEAVYGSVYKVFQGGKKGRDACLAIGALANVGQIDSTITNFLVPLQALVDKKKRIHCSLNLNTETGRLSSRKPNLQNQPALEKDQYRIRDAFIAEPGNTLIVADYGQLELRLLAHITQCKSMLDAFKNGGCFHSRTAVGMYDYIKKAVDNKEVLLEWDYSKGQPTVPLVKDTYGSERRKAKTLNFSIAYGKTVHGLALDWGISKEEAQETLDAWYRDRPEVREWQEKTRNFAKKNGFVRTLMGRYRILHDAVAPISRGQQAAAGHALRAAINTPIQGSAADIVMMAMIKLFKSPVLQSLGWKLLLQIHDEVILEGPKETCNEAMREVRACMEQPFDGYGLQSLDVFLDVDAKSADSWYKAK